MNKYTYLTIGITTVLVTVGGYLGVTLGKGGWHHGGDDFDYITEPIAQITDETVNSKRLIEYTKNEFGTREVVQVDENMYVAIGWALANVIMIVGDDGVIIVDTTENVVSMKEIMVEFRKITNLPVKAIIFTHFHTDHITGTKYIIDEEHKVFPNITIDIYSHDITKQLMLGFSDVYDVAFTRGVRQFGAIVPPIGTGCGLGPTFRVDATSDIYIPLPTVTFSTHASYKVAGIDFELIHSPGETDDQITVWLPQTRAVLPGDNIYRTFPNLYAIRGSPARNAKRWYQSLDLMRALNGKYLIGSHTQPVEGEDAVYNTLLVYRDAIKYVHDQTVRYLNKGYFPGEIIEAVHLPDKVSKHASLQEHYGTVAWSIRGVFTNYLGWFSGDPKELNPMTANDHAKRMARLVTYAKNKKVSATEVMLQEAQISHKISNDHYRLTGKHILSDDKWALELADAVLELSTDGNLTFVARQIKVSALRAIGIEQVSPNGRNYYLTYAMETEYGLVIERTKDSKSKTVHSEPIDRLLGSICAKVDGLTCQYKNYTVALTFTDIDKTYAQTLRNAVCDVLEEIPADKVPQVHLSTTTDVFKSIKTEELDLDTEVTLGTVTVVSGKLDEYKAFDACFESIMVL